MFQHVEPYAGDPILSLNEAFHKDPRPNKVNLSIGIYFDDEGRLPVLESVRRAEARLLSAGGPKPYLPIEGAANFRTEVQALLFGATHEAVVSRRVATIQSVGSSGGLKVGADFIARYFPGSAVWVERPDLGQPPRDVRGRRASRCTATRTTTPAMPCGAAPSRRRAALRRDAGHAARAPAGERRAAARLLPQPDRRRPEPRPMGGADPGAARAPADPLPRPRLPGLRRGHRAPTPGRCASWPSAGLSFFVANSFSQEHERLRRALRRAERRVSRCRPGRERARPAQVHGASQLLEPADPRRPAGGHRAGRPANCAACGRPNSRRCANASSRCGARCMRR